MRRFSTSYRLFQLFNYSFLALVSLLCILPMLHLLAVSLSDRAAATGNIVNFWPVGLNWEAYEHTLGNANFIQSFWIAVKRTFLGTLIGMTICLITSYSLSKYEERFKGRTIYAWFFVFTMLFGGGLIPTYLVVTKTGLTDTIWALIIPGAVNVWNIILMLNFFRSLPAELEEAALIDGAGHFKVLLRIFLPVSMPSIATLSLFEMVGHWNSWFDAMIYMTRQENYPLATFLHTIVVSENMQNVGLDPGKLKNLSNRTIKASQIFIGALPILLIYPLLQKYFVKGIVLGSVKG